MVQLPTRIRAADRFTIALCAERNGEVWERFFRELAARHRSTETQCDPSESAPLGLGRERMARPGCKRQLGGSVTNLYERIRHVGSVTAAKMEMRVFRSS